MLWVRELSLLPECPAYSIATFLCRRLQSEAERLNRKREKPLRGIQFNLGSEHPVYTALDGRLEKMKQPYAWYLRVPDLPVFLRHIGPELEARLKGSAMAGYAGALKLNCYTSQYRLEFDEGQLTAVEPYRAQRFFDGDAFFPGLTFLQLLFGYRSLEELRHAFSDCFAEEEKYALLLDILFPKRPSEVIALG